MKVWGSRMVFNWQESRGGGVSESVSAKDRHGRVRNEGRI